MKDCCLAEACKSLKRHRDVATCDTCGALLLAYGNARDFDAALEELVRHGVNSETAEIAKLKVIVKTG